MDPRKGFDNNTVGKEEEETGELLVSAGLRLQRSLTTHGYYPLNW